MEFRSMQYEIKYGGKKFLADSKESLFDNIKNYCDSKNIFFSLTKEYVERQAKEFKQKGNDASVSVERKGNIKFADAVNGAAAVVKVAMGQVVPQEEINRRAILCTNCSKLKKVSNCFACGFAGTLNKFISKVKATIFKAGFEIPNKLSSKYCGVCSCSLAMMIPSKMSAFNEDDEKNKSRPDHCWIKKSSKNFLPCLFILFLLSSCSNVYKEIPNPDNDGSRLFYGKKGFITVDPDGTVIRTDFNF